MEEVSVWASVKLARGVELFYGNGRAGLEFERELNVEKLVGMDAMNDMVTYDGKSKESVSPMFFPCD